MLIRSFPCSLGLFMRGGFICGLCFSRAGKNYIHERSEENAVCWRGLTASIDTEANAAFNIIIRRC